MSLLNKRAAENKVGQIQPKSKRIDCYLVLNLDLYREINFGFLVLGFLQGVQGKKNKSLNTKCVF